MSSGPLHTQHLHCPHNKNTPLQLSLLSSLNSSSKLKNDFRKPDLFIHNFIQTIRVSVTLLTLQHLPKQFAVSLTEILSTARQSSAVPGHGEVAGGHRRLFGRKEGRVCGRGWSSADMTLALLLSFGVTALLFSLSVLFLFLVIVVVQLLTKDYRF